MRGLLVLLALVVGVGAGVGAFLALGAAGPSATAPGVVAPPAASDAALGAAAVSASASSESTAAPEAATADPSAAPVASALASAVEAATDQPATAGSAADSAPEPLSPEQTQSCLRSFFSRDAFVVKSPSLSFVCTEKKPKDIASRLRVAIVEASGGNVSESMKEWSQIGFYELAVVATLRGRCCAGAERLAVPEAPEGCDSIPEAVDALGRASRRGAPSKELDDALASFDERIRCTLKLKRGAIYGYSRIDPGEATAYGKIRARMTSAD